MIPYEVIESEPKHVRMLAERLRAGDRAEITCAGLPVMKAIWKSYRNGIIRKTAFVEGEIAAMWGCGGVLLSNRGTPWLLTTPAVERVPVSMVKEAKKNLNAMLDIWPILMNYVDVNYKQAVKFLELVGFDIYEPEPFGSKGALFHRIEMRR